MNIWKAPVDESNLNGQNASSVICTTYDDGIDSTTIYSDTLLAIATDFFQ